MKTATVVMIATVLAQYCLAEDFYLRHEASGKLYGPYSTTEGAEITIGKTVFTVSKPQKTQSASSRLAEIRKALDTLAGVKSGTRGVYIRKAGQRDDMLLVSCTRGGNDPAEWKLGVTYDFTGDAKQAIKRLGIAIPEDWYQRQQEGLGMSYTPQKSDVKELADVINSLLTKLYKIPLSEKLSFTHENYEM